MWHPDFIMVYKHEHTHLENHDNLVKLLCLFVLCLHWMNPVAYLLLFLYIDTAEIVSDSVAVDGCTKEKRQDYAKLLVLEASTSDIRPAVWKNNLSGHKNNKEGKDFKTLKRRITYMMKEKRKGMWLFSKKKAIFSTQLGTGVLFQVPFMERSSAVFIESEELYCNAEKRLESVIARLEENGNEVHVIRAGTVPLLQIDNLYYECIPTQHKYYRVPVFGVQLRRYIM